MTLVTNAYIIHIFNMRGISIACSQIQFSTTRKVFDEMHFPYVAWGVEFMVADKCQLSFHVVACCSSTFRDNELLRIVSVAQPSISYRY